MLPRWHVPGLSLTLREGRRSLAVAVACGLGFGLWMALADATFLQGAVPASQHEIIAQSTAPQRIAAFWKGALVDEVVLRLGAMTLAVWLLQRVCGLRGRAASWPAIVMVALVCWPLLRAWPYLAGLNWTAGTILRELLLHVSAGILWGWLYARHGWLAGLAGHWSAHLALQPLLGAIGPGLA